MEAETSQTTYRQFALTLAAALLAVVSFAGAQPPQPPAFTAPQAQARPMDEPIDINTASAAQLNALPGFGPAYTRRVIAGRPYFSKNQLVTHGVIPQGAYERIAPLIVAHRPAHHRAAPGASAVTVIRNP